MIQLWNIAPIKVDRTIRPATLKGFPNRNVDIGRIPPNSFIEIAELPTIVRSDEFNWYRFMYKGQVAFVAFESLSSNARFIEIRKQGIVTVKATPRTAHIDGRHPFKTTNPSLITMILRLEGQRLAWSDEKGFIDLIGREKDRVLKHQFEIDTEDPELTYYYFFEDVIGERGRMFVGITDDMHFTVDGNDHYTLGGFWVKQADYFAIVTKFNALQKGE